MNEIEHLSIGGYAFRLEVDAAAQLRNYIGSLESYYLPQPDGREIMDSIEERLAELLTGRQVDVVKAEDVAAVTAILGKPEAIEDSVPGLEEAPATGRNDQPQRRPLFRVVEGRSLGGVCGGLAAWIGVNVSIPRIIFVTATLLPLLWDGDGIFVAPMVYLVLWLCVPAARTVEQKYRQRGESLRVDDIRQTVRSGMVEVRDAALSIGRASAWSTLGNFIRIVVGLVLLVTGASGLLFGGFALLGDHLLGADRFFNGFASQLSYSAPILSNALSNTWVQVLLMMAAFLPLLGMLYVGLQLVFGFRSPKWRPGLVILILWLISLIVLSGLLVALMNTGQIMVRL